MARTRAFMVGLVASWVKALSEPPLQAVAERIMPPSRAQKHEVGANPTGHPENMPPAVLVNRAATALGHAGLTARQRVRIQRLIHYGFGGSLGVPYSAAASRWPAASRGRGALAGLASYIVWGTALETVRRTLAGRGTHVPGRPRR